MIITNYQIHKTLGVPKSTLTGWQRNKPELLEAVRLGVEQMLSRNQSTKNHKTGSFTGKEAVLGESGDNFNDMFINGRDGGRANDG